MSTDTKSAIDVYLSQFSESDWSAAINEMQKCIHAVDKDAVQIWFRFYPIDLARYLAAAENPEEAAQGIAFQGNFDLAGNAAVSHHFLYGHRFWPVVKSKVEARASEPFAADASLTDIIKEIGIAAAEKLGVERDLVNGIVAVSLATVAQIGFEAFAASNDAVQKPSGIMAKSPDAIVAERAKDDSQGLFGFLRSIDKKFSIAFSADNFSGKFPVVYDQQVTHAAEADRSQDWREMDERCWEGPIPVECTAASCGTCWVGVIGGKEKLSEVDRRERRAMQVFGYEQPNEAKPFLRLACQTKAYGNATLVIPPWNGVFGKKVRGNVEDVELEPNTTSAKRLREVVKEAISGE